MYKNKENKMKVQKRNGNYEDISFDKILKRIQSLSIDSKFVDKLKIDESVVAQKVIKEIYDGVKTSELDELASQISISMYSKHPDFKILAGRIIISNHHKNTLDTFSDKIELMYNYVSNDINKPLIADYLYKLVMDNAEKINSVIDYNKDYLFDFFGFKTLEKNYLYKLDKNIIERPQDMLMRVSLSIHRNDIDKAIENYELMSNHYFTHATPTLYNAGSRREQFASCFLLTMKEDSITGIYDTLKDCALISKHAGGIGLSIHNIRATDSYISGTNGISNGLVPMLRVFNDTARYVDQCIVPETIIYTTDGPKEIKDCELNKTEIFTTNGNELIENVLEHSYNGEIYEIETMYSLESLKITGEHPVLCLTDQKKGLNYDVIKNRLMKKLISPEWVEAKELSENDLLLFKIPKYEVDNINITKDDCYMYGLILGDGCMYPSSTNCYLSLHSESKKEIIDSVIDYLNKRCIENRCVIEGLTTRVYWKRNTKLIFRHCDIYDVNKEKHITSKWLNLPIEKSKYILKGLIDTDGCKGNELVFDSTSRNLIESLRYILLRMGIPSSGYIRDRRGESHISIHGDKIENKKISYTLRIPKCPLICELLNIECGDFSKYFIFEDYIATRVKSINKSHYEGVLYDLQMKNTHNYMIHNGIVHNGGGKRNGSFAMYLEPWHSDIFEFIELKKNHGNEFERARDLFYALWVPDLFMERVHSDDEWSLFCPNECPGLSDTWGKEFNELYISYETQNKFRKKVKARELWSAILTSQIEVGMPYILYKDACNRKSNQQNLGTIKSSNLCTEIVEYTSSEETAVCNLASISLKKFVKHKDVSNMNFLIYTKENCVYCELTKGLFNKKDIKYITKDYTEFKKDDDKKITFPQIYLITEENVYIGGYTELSEYLKPSYDFDSLKSIAKRLTHNLNNIIDYNYYPIPETRVSNMRHRPIGIGVQGLANVFFEFGYPFDSEDAKHLNENIFETIYYGAMEASMELSRDREKLYKKYILLKCKYDTWLDSNINGETMSASEARIVRDEYESIKNKLNMIPEELDREEYFGSYSSFIGSPLHQGKYQFDLWNINITDIRHDWSGLMKNIKKYGVRNSLLLAPMPTASTAQILGNYECFEPILSNIYTRRVLSGEYMVINEYLVNDLISLNLWNTEMKDKIILNDGSIQNIKEIPNILKNIYKTVWEIRQKQVLNMAIDRGKFICQSQSMNLFLESPDIGTMSSMHSYSWKKGLKTGIYYLRSRPSSRAIQFTLNPTECENCSG